MLADDPRTPARVTPTSRRSPWATRAEELWDAWVFAAFEAELALDAWKKAASGLKESAFAAYHAALDREEQAAAALASRIAPKAGKRLHTRWALGRTAG
jgi:hypothetical protein